MDKPAICVRKNITELKYYTSAKRNKQLQTPRLKTKIFKSKIVDYITKTVYTTIYKILSTIKDEIKESFASFLKNYM